jgi:hypothetical protein
MHVHVGRDHVQEAAEIGGEWITMREFTVTGCLFSRDTTVNMLNKQHSTVSRRDVAFGFS